MIFTIINGIIWLLVFITSIWLNKIDKFTFSMMFITLESYIVVITLHCMGII